MFFSVGCFVWCCWLLFVPSVMTTTDRSSRKTALPPFNNTRIRYYDPSLWCRPINPTLNKENTLNNLRRNHYTAPMMFWHVQKAGGSSLCSTFIRSYSRTTTHSLREIYPWYANCNDPEMSTDIIMNQPSYVTKYRPYGKYFVAIEPSHSMNNSWKWVDPNDFPFKYHDQPATKVLLDPTHPSTDAAWNAAVHFIAVRHPLQLAISAINYAFQPDHDTLLDRCDALNLTINACLLAMIQVAEQPVPSPILSSIYLRYQEEQQKDPTERNIAKYNQEQFQLATAHLNNPSFALHHTDTDSKNHEGHLPITPTTPTTPPQPQRSTSLYTIALATADAALKDISMYRGQLLSLAQRKFKVESFRMGRHRGKPKDDFSDYIYSRLHRKRNVTTATTTTITTATIATPTTLLRTTDGNGNGTAAMVTNVTDQRLPSEPLFSIWQVCLYKQSNPMTLVNDHIFLLTAPLSSPLLPSPLRPHPFSPSFTYNMFSSHLLGTSYTLSDLGQLLHSPSISQQRH